MYFFFFEQAKIRYINKKQSPQHKTYQDRLQWFTKSQRMRIINKSYKDQIKQKTRQPDMTFYILILDDVYILKWQAFVFPRWSCIP
jgi:hypothetical protein